VTIAPFADRLRDACAFRGAPACVGLDPRWADLPEVLRRGRPDSAEGRAAAFVEFHRAVLAVVAPVVPVVKPQIAFYEALGAPGFAAYLDAVATARAAGLIVIGDVKRGDLGTTAEAYAEGHFDRAGADALTLSPYLGADSVEPFLARCRDAGRGVFLLVKTSNPGSRDLQDLDQGGEPLHARVGDMVARLGDGPGLRGASGWSSVGAVVGATHPRELAALRARLPRTPFLVPGYGAQGGTAADVAAAFGTDGSGGVVSSSRGVIFAYRSGPGKERHGEARWERAVEEAAVALRDDLRAAIAARPRGAGGP
jgi:orotidine-5'-phosphate decarboxylase